MVTRVGQITDRTLHRFQPISLGYRYLTDIKSWISLLVQCARIPHCFCSELLCSRFVPVCDLSFFGQLFLSLLPVLSCVALRPCLRWCAVSVVDQHGANIWDGWEALPHPPPLVRLERAPRVVRQAAAWTLVIDGFADISSSISLHASQQFQEIVQQLRVPCFNREHICSSNCNMMLPTSAHRLSPSPPHPIKVICGSIYSSSSFYAYLERIDS